MGAMYRFTDEGTSSLIVTSTARLSKGVSWPMSHQCIDQMPGHRGVLLLVLRLVLAGSRCQGQDDEEDGDQRNSDVLHGFDFNSCFWKKSHIRSLAETFVADLPSVAAGDFRPGQV